jgi:hypothetical protein
MRNLLKRFVLSLSPPPKPPLSETERLIAELEDAKEKMACAWSRLDNAAPEYVELTVLEILVLETQYSLLNKRFRLLQGTREESNSPIFIPSTSMVSHTSYSLEGQLQHHAFYGTFFKSMSETSATESQHLISSN